MDELTIKTYKETLPEFREKTAAFFAGQLPMAAYKGFSGFYGSYAEKGGQTSMVRLRMPGGRVTAQRLAFVAKAIRQYGIDKVHFTTCQTIQLHHVAPKDVADLIEQALDSGIVTLGGGGDFPRNVMCSPLSGTQADEYFDVLPWAEAAGAYLMTFLGKEKLPRKLKVGFSASPANLTHATYRDLGFAARPDGTFDVYSAGGLGNNPRVGVLVAQVVSPQDILYYIKAMWNTFCAYGNYDNRAKARTRYMVDALGGPDAYAAAYNEELAKVKADGENLTLHLADPVLAGAKYQKASDASLHAAAPADNDASTGESRLKKDVKAAAADVAHAAGDVGRDVAHAAKGTVAFFGDATKPEFPGDAPLEPAAQLPAQWNVLGQEGVTGPLPGRVLVQKQPGLFTVVWHPIGGKPNAQTLCAVNDALQVMPGAEMRLGPDQTAYFVNLTGPQAKQLLALTPDSARTRFETSVACIGSGVCQVGLRDSQALLAACVDAARAANLPDGALPKLYISGCPSSCGTHQTGTLGLRGGTKQVDGKPQPAFVLYAGGCQRQGEEAFGAELGPIEQSRIPAFLVALGQAVAATGQDYADWAQANPEGLAAIAAPYL